MNHVKSNNKPISECEKYLTDLATLEKRLHEAETAYHLLMTGSKEVSVAIGDYGSVTYNTSNIDKLETYIASLKAKISRKTGKPRRKAIFVEF